jgi:hypothetical protein
LLAGVDGFIIMSSEDDVKLFGPVQLYVKTPWQDVVEEFRLISIPDPHCENKLLILGLGGYICSSLVT